MFARNLMRIVLIAGMLLIGGWSRASVIYTQTFSPNASVPAGNVPTVFNGNFTADPNAGNAVLLITVQLNVTGGYSGLFSLALTGPDGSTTVDLIYQPGTATSGLNLTLADTGTTITSGSNLSGGTWAPYAPLSGLNGQTANGVWTLAFANEAGPADTLNSWTLNITVVPEPVNVALGVFGILFATAIVARRRAKKLAVSRQV